MNNHPKHKLYNFEVTPPVGVWDHIAAELDELEIGNKYPEKLYHYEVAPPHFLWNKITTVLDSFPEGAVPEKRKMTPLLRYAAAAVVIALMIWGGFQYFSKNSADSEIAGKNPGPLRTDSIIASEKNQTQPEENPASTPPIATTTEQDAIDNAALEASKKTYAKHDVPGSKIKDVSNFYFAPEMNPSGTRGLNFDGSGNSELNTMDRYIMLMTPDGNIIRMSKKLSDLVCCIIGEQQDENCINRMKNWREKIANSAVGHSPGNFMDILDLVTILQNEEE